MVRLVVVQGEEPGEPAGSYPRPAVRGHCGTLPCPACGERVAMRASKAGSSAYHFACPECGAAVWYEEVGDSSWRWSPEPREDVPPAEALNHCRPCPWVSCSQHLFLDAPPDGISLRFNFPGREPWELDETCALDVAERDGATLEEVGKMVNLTRERVRQLIEEAKGSARHNTNPMFTRHLDVEDLGSLPTLRHPLGDVE